MIPEIVAHAKAELKLTGRLVAHHFDDNYDEIDAFSSAVFPKNFQDLSLTIVPHLYVAYATYAQNIISLAAAELAGYYEDFLSRQKAGSKTF